MASLTRIVSPPLRPVLPRPRPPRAWVLRPRPLLPHVGPRRLLSAPLRRESPVSTVPPEAARRVVERAEPRVRVVPARADPGARFDRVVSRAAPRTTTEEAPPVKTPVARRAAEAAAPPPAVPAPRLRTRPIVEAGPQQPTPQVAPPEVGEPRALRPAPPRPSAPAAVRTAPQLRPTVVPPSPVANDAPLRPAAPRTVAVPTAETHASRPAPAPAVGAREAAPPRATPVQNERPRAEVRPA